MRDIRNLEIPDHFHRFNFGHIVIIEENANGGSADKSYYRISRDSLMSLMIRKTAGLQFLEHTSIMAGGSISSPRASKEAGQ
jgi:hypothetical protein